MLTLKCNNFGHLQEKVNDAITKINSQGDSSKFLKNLQKTLFFHNTSQFGLTKFSLAYFFLMVGTVRITTIIKVLKVFIKRRSTKILTSNWLLNYIKKLRYFLSFYAT